MRKITFLLFTLITTLIIGQEKLTSSIEERLDGTTWENTSRTSYKYDDNKNLIEQEYDSWDSNNSSWTNSGKEIFTYNSMNKVINQTYESGDYGSKAIYTYNSSNQLVERISQDKENNVWVNQYRALYSYSSNKLIEFSDQSWNGTSWEYSNGGEQEDSSSKYNISYGSNGLISEIILEDWNGTSWDVGFKEIYTYNANDKFLEKIGQGWNGNSFENEEKEIFNYDANGNVVLNELFIFSNGSYESEEVVNYTFDTNQMLSNFIHPFVDRFGFDALLGKDNKFVNKIIGSSTNTNSEYRTTYNYGESTASVNDSNLVNFTVHPNPTTSILNIDDSNFTLKNIEVYNIIGKRVLRSTKNKINIENLVNGVYLLKVQSEDGNFATKRIIKN